jgi:hypothetical protein
MATSYSPKIITDGLVLCLDAGDSKSYSGSGTTWYDRTPNNYNGVFVGTPQHGDANQGVFEFDGVNTLIYSTVDPDDYFTSGSFTWNIWVKHESYSGDNQNMPDHGYGSGSWPRAGWFHDDTNDSWIWRSYSSAGSSSQYYLEHSSVTNYLNWHMLTITIDRDNTVGKSYSNGELDSTKNSVPDLAGNNNRFGVGRGGWSHAGWNHDWRGSVGLVQLYSKVLTASEVLQNYNATKGRFGL